MMDISQVRNLDYRVLIFLNQFQLKEREAQNRMAL